MVQFILGKSGSGKTKQLHDIIENRCVSESVILFVPEQFTYETESVLFKRLGASAFANLQVTSFSRFAREVFRKYGGIAMQDASDSAKLIMMELTIASLSNHLDVYKKSAGTKTFSTVMLDTISELKNAGVSDDDFISATQNLDSGSYLFKKAHELALIYSQYNKRLYDTYNDPLDDITRAGKKLVGKGYFEGYTVIIDEFKGFTANENDIIKQIFSGASEVYVSLCLDVVRCGSSDISPFSSVGETYSRLMRLCKEQGVTIKPPIKLEKQYRFQSKMLEHIEENLYSPNIEVFDKPQDNSATAMLCYNEYDEVEYTLSTICDLVSMEGYSYSDIAIIARNLDGYISKLSIACEKYKIPLYADIRSGIAQMPLIRFVRLCFACVLEGYSSDNVLALLKSGVLGFDQNAVAELENYVFVWGITKKQWFEEFSQCPRGYSVDMSEQDKAVLVRISAVREQIISALGVFEVAIKTTDAKAISIALLKLIHQLNVKQVVQQDIVLLSETGQLDDAQEQLRIWEILIEVVDTIATVAGDKPVTAKQYCKLYNQICEQYDRGTITQSIDCVIAGSADRIRISDKKAVFVIGVNDNVLPYVPSASGIFTDKEREQLISMDICISQPIKDKILEERFIAYKALCSPSHKLYLTASVANIEGKPLAPSQIFYQLKKMFGEDVVNSTDCLGGEYYCKNKLTAFSQLAKRYGEDSEFTATLRDLLGEDLVYANKLERLDEISNRGEICIKDTSIATEIFKKNMVSSPTGVEGYYQCSFRYFCEKGLNIRPLRRAELNPLETGTLIHKVVHSITTTTDLKAPLDQTELKRKIKTELDAYINEVMGGAKDKTNRFIYLYNRLSQSIMKIIEHLHEELMQSAFVPTDFECDIKEGGEIEPLKLVAQNGVSVTVSGKVDRIDTYENRKGERYVRVIDYKSGKKVFSLSDVYSGLNLQMLIYLFCIQDTKDGRYNASVPAGILYMPASDIEPELDRNAGERDLRELKARHYKMNGLILNDPDVISAMDNSGGVYIPVSHNKDGSLSKKSYDSLASLQDLAKINKYIKSLIVRMADELHAGKIPAYPSVGACDYCDYGSVCHKNSATKIKPKHSFSKEAVVLQMENDMREEQNDEQCTLY